MNKDKRRQLAAIMFCDIEGYTALMQDDEAYARQLLNKFHLTITTNVNDHNGQVINNYGDGCVCTFDSAVAAMKCAKVLQQTFYVEPNLDSGKIKVPVRIGLHCGDVFFEKDNVYGDSVNIASRIESLGVAGAILFSKEIKRHISNQNGFKIQSLGEFEFKNVKESMEVFALVNEGIAIPRKEDLTGKLKKHSPKKRNTLWRVVFTLVIVGIIGWLWYNDTKAPNSLTLEVTEKSIAILPFRNLSAEKDNQFFCEGVMEAILSHLSKVKGLKVISRASVEQFDPSKQSKLEIANQLGVNHILEGSVQRINDKIRISAQLYQPKNDEQFWSEMYDGTISQVFELQSKVAQKVVTSLEIQLATKTTANWSIAPTNDLLAYEYYLKGVEEMNQFTIFGNNKIKLDDEVYDKAQQNYEKAIEIDSNLAMAYVGMARTYWEKNLYHTWKEENHMDTTRILCEKALSIDSTLSEAHSLLGDYFLRQKNKEAFIFHQTKALELNPNAAEVYANLGGYYSGNKIDVTPNYKKGINYYKQAIELDPFSNNTTAYYSDLSWVFMALNDLDEAQNYAKKVLDAENIWASSIHLFLIQGQYEQAEILAKQWEEKENLQAYYHLAEIQVNHYKNYKKAIQMYKAIESTFGTGINFKNRLGLAYWLDGQKEIGKELLEKSLQEYDDYRELRGLQFCYDEAGVFATLGNKEKALSILRNTNCDLCCALEFYITIDPLYQNLWEEEEFKEIVAARKSAKAKLRKTID